MFLYGVKHYSINLSINHLDYLQSVQRGRGNISDIYRQHLLRYMNKVFKYIGPLNAVWSRRDFIAWNRLLILFWWRRVGPLCVIAQLLSQSNKPYSISEVYLSSSVTVLLQKFPLPFIFCNAYYNKGYHVSHNVFQL